MVYNQDINLDLNTRSPSLILGAKQFDNKSRSIIAAILQDGIPINIPSNATATYRIQKPNGTCVWNAAEVLSSENKIKILFTSEDLDCSGRNVVDILLSVGTNTLGTTNFIIDVQSAPIIDDAQNTGESRDYLAQLVESANEMIEDAQAWAEGKRGSSELVQDGYDTAYNSAVFSLSFNWDTFKANMPHESGTIIEYKFVQIENGIWELNDSDIVNMSQLGFTMTALGSGIPVGPESQIVVTASYQDDAWQNHAKYYAEAAASSAATISSMIAQVSYNLASKLNTPYYSTVAPSNPSAGDYWVDTATQIALTGEVVGSNNIKENSIQTRHIDDLVITANQIRNSAIEPRHLSEGVVTASAIATHVITGTQISQYTITDYNIAPNAVGSNALQSNIIYNYHLTQGAVDSQNIANYAIKVNHLAQNAVTSYSVASNAISKAALMSQVINQSKMASEFIKFGTIPGHNQGDPDEDKGTLWLQTLQGVGSAIIFITGPASRGIINYYCTINGNTNGSSFIGYAEASMSSISEYSQNKPTYLSLTSSQDGFLKIVNEAYSEAAYMAIMLSSNVSISVTP